MTEYNVAQNVQIGTFTQEVKHWQEATDNESAKDVDEYTQNASRHLRDFTDEERKVIVDTLKKELKGSS